MPVDAFQSIKNRIKELSCRLHSISENATREMGRKGGPDTLDALVPGDSPDTMRWPDIDYSNQNTLVWDASKHYVRILSGLLKMGPGKLQEDVRSREKIIAAIRFWVEGDFKNPNWWHNDIGVPRNFGDIAVLVWDYLPEDLKPRLIEIIGRGSMKTRKDIPRWTGANLIWGITTTIRHAALTEDADLLRTAVDRAILEMAIKRGGREGIKPDASFWQHGPRLYSGGYGRAFAEDVARIAYVLQDTEYAIPSFSLKTICYFLLGGLSRMTHKKGMDYAIPGREMTRKDTLKTSSILGVIDILLQTAGVPEKEKLEKMALELKGEKESEPGISYFPYVCMMTQKGPNTYFGVKCQSNKLYGAEICTGEGRLCLNMSYGSHICLMHTGEEYVNIMPVWDYSKIPGTTAREEDDAELSRHTDWPNKVLPNAVSGGLKRGSYGVIYEQAEHDGIKAKVAYFLIPGQLIMLGSDITDETPQKGRLFTTLNQCKPVDSPVQREDGSVELDGFLYRSLNKNNRLILETSVKEGAWHRNNQDEPFVPMSMETATVYAGCDPARDNTYAYVIEDLRHAERQSFRILCNDAARQEILLEDGTDLSVDYSETGGFCQITKK